MLTPIQIIALIFVLLGSIKLIVISLNKNKWLDIISPLYKNSKLTSWIALLLAIVIFYYLIQIMSIVQIMAVMGFTSLFFAFAFMQYSNEVLSLAKKIMNKKFSFSLIL